MLRTAARSGLLPSPLPWQVYVHARIAETDDAGARVWRRAGLVVGRGNGKSDGVLCPYVLDSVVQGIGVLGLAQNLDVAMETFTKVADTVEGDPYLSRRITKLYRGKGNARLSLRDPRTNRVATYRVAVTAKKCRGPRAPRLAVDEAAYVDDAVLSAARYVQNGSGLTDQQQVLAVCTAGDDSEDENGELQWYSRMRAAYLEGIDPRLLWLEYSLPDDADPTDRQLWPYAVPALGYLIQPVEIEDNLGDPAFTQEVLSRWGVTVRRAIPADAWAAQLLTDDQRAQLQLDQPAPVGLALAVSTDGARTSLTASYEWQGRLVLKVLDDRAGTSWAVRVAREWQERTRLPWVVDAVGPAGPLVDSLRAAGVGLEVVTLDEYANACAALLDDVREGGRLAHYGQPALDLAVAAARRRTVGERWVWARRAGEIAALEAGTLAAARARHRRAGARVR